MTVALVRALSRLLAVANSTHFHRSCQPSAGASAAAST